MSDFDYKPRLGYDIRVRPPGEKDTTPAWATANTRLCDVKGCERKAAVRVATSPRDPDVKAWYCAEHARQHNLRWNYFDGLSESEAAAARLAGTYGDRPTWAMGRNDRARASTRARGPADLKDAFGIFTETGRKQTAAAALLRNGRPVPKLQAQAFDTLGLKVSAAAPEIRRRYAELVRQYHPDANGGDRSAETQLAAVVRAHQVLKKAGIC